MHQTVLLQEAVTALVTATDGVYIDGTFGRGGHSRAILSMLGQEGRLLAVDKDLQACSVAAELKGSDSRFDFEHTTFAQLPHQLRRWGIGAVDGILLDLGVSSPQLDQADRGFSFNHDGPLDMRMDTTRGETAAQWLATVKHGDLARVLREYGEERHAGRIASAILREREQSEISTTARLAHIVAEANPSWEKHKHPATRSFQAIRIYINRELDELEEFLEASLQLLAPAGRLVIISFHSLEDRLVKRFMREKSRGAQLPKGVPIRDADVVRELKLLGKPIKAGTDELGDNPRARSAVMRVAERVHVG
jgi:16S rRNA (cytosine1402-N4)-methyltransferase